MTTAHLRVTVDTEKKETYLVIGGGSLVLEPTQVKFRPTGKRDDPDEVCVTWDQLTSMLQGKSADCAKQSGGTD